MSEIKLKKHNRKKYCLHCEEIFEIEMKGTEGYCPECGRVLYTIKNNMKGLK